MGIVLLDGRLGTAVCRPRVRGLSCNPGACEWCLRRLDRVPYGRFRAGSRTLVVGGGGSRDLYRRETLGAPRQRLFGG